MPPLPSSPTNATDNDDGHDEPSLTRPSSAPPARMASAAAPTPTLQSIAAGSLDRSLGPTASAERRSSLAPPPAVAIATATSMSPLSHDDINDDDGANDNTQDDIETKVTAPVPPPMARSPAVRRATRVAVARHGPVPQPQLQPATHVTVPILPQRQSHTMVSNHNNHHHNNPRHHSSSHAPVAAVSTAPTSTALAVHGDDLDDLEACLSTISVLEHELQERGHQCTKLMEVNNKLKQRLQQFATANEDNVVHAESQLGQLHAQVRSSNDALQHAHTRIKQLEDAQLLTGQHYQYVKEVERDRTALQHKLAAGITDESARRAFLQQIAELTTSKAALTTELEKALATWAYVILISFLLVLVSHHIRTCYVYIIVARRNNWRQPMRSCVPS
jgi:uncharacterized protein YoxC